MSADLLDSIIAGYGVNRIVSEEHDTNKVSVGEGDIKSALGNLTNIPWDAGEYGISRAEVQRRIEAADTPEAREQVLVDLRARALTRAGLDTSTGKVAVAVAGKPAWHGLGVNVAEAMTSAEAIRLASLDWSVGKRQLAFALPDGSYREAPGAFGVVREDTNSHLGVVGSQYRPIQNAEAFDFLDGVLRQFGARYESAGAVFGGRQIWLQVRLPQQSFTLNGNDRNDAFCVFFNPHDGSGAAHCYPTSERVVCANTLRIANNGRARGISLRHNGNLTRRIEEAQDVLGLAVTQFDHYRDQAEVLAKTPLAIEPYADLVLDAVLEVTAAQARAGADALAAALDIAEADRELKRKAIQRQIDTRKNLLTDILTRYESGTNGVGGMRGSAWSGLNAVTEAADHGPLGGRFSGTDHDKASRRFESVLSGRADEVKQVAFAAAVATISA